jgi:hypothetical protein
VLFRKLELYKKKNMVFTTSDQIIYLVSSNMSMLYVNTRLVDTDVVEHPRHIIVDVIVPRQCVHAMEPP